MVGTWKVLLAPVKLPRSELGANGGVRVWWEGGASFRFQTPSELSQVLKSAVLESRSELEDFPFSSCTPFSPNTAAPGFVPGRKDSLKWIEY